MPRQHAENKAKYRARGTDRANEITANGGPRPPKGLNPGLDWFARHLKPRRYEDVKDQLIELGEAECLISAVSISGGGATFQMQVLPAYLPMVVDMAQRTTQGVLMCRFSQVDWGAHRDPDDPVWQDEEPDDDDAA